MASIRESRVGRKVILVLDLAAEAGVNKACAITKSRHIKGIKLQLQEEFRAQTFADDTSLLIKIYHFTQGLCKIHQPF